MEFIKTTTLSNSIKKELLSLWNNEYPEKLCYTTLSSFENYLANLTELSHVLMCDENQVVKGWYFDFYRDNKKWFAILIASELHGQGLGTVLLNLAKEKETELNGWVIDHNKDKKQNGNLYTSPLNFYLKNDFKILPKNRLELDTLSAVHIRWHK